MHHRKWSSLILIPYYSPFKTYLPNIANRLTYWGKKENTVEDPFLHPFFAGTLSCIVSPPRKSKKVTLGFQNKNWQTCLIIYFIWVIFRQRRAIFSYFCLCIQIYYVFNEQNPSYQIDSRIFSSAERIRDALVFCLRLWTDTNHRRRFFFAPNASLQTHASVQRSIGFAACDWLDWIIFTFWPLWNPTERTLTLTRCPNLHLFRDFRGFLHFNFQGQIIVIQIKLYIWGQYQVYLLLAVIYWFLKKLWKVSRNLRVLGRKAGSSIFA